MSPYRLPPAQPRPAPAAPWWRVAWAVLSRELTRRLVERAMRRRALVLPVPDSVLDMTYAQFTDLHPFTRGRLLEAIDRERARGGALRARVEQRMGFAAW